MEEKIILDIIDSEAKYGYCAKIKKNTKMLKLIQIANLKHCLMKNQIMVPVLYGLRVEKTGVYIDPDDTATLLDLNDMDRCIFEKKNKK